MDSNKITIKFELVGEVGDHYEASSTFEIYRSLGDTVVDAIGTQLNAFLRQAGFLRKNDNIFMEDISDEEYEAISDFLEDFRAKNQSKNAE